MSLLPFSSLTLWSTCAQRCLTISLCYNWLALNTAQILNMWLFYDDNQILQKFWIAFLFFIKKNSVNNTYFLPQIFNADLWNCLHTSLNMFMTLWICVKNLYYIFALFHPPLATWLFLYTGTGIDFCWIYLLLTWWPSPLILIKCLCKIWFCRRKLKKMNTTIEYNKTGKAHWVTRWAINKSNKNRNLDIYFKHVTFLWW
jgi:hypothetical protein